MNTEARLPRHEPIPLVELWRLLNRLARSYDRHDATAAWVSDRELVIECPGRAPLTLTFLTGAEAEARHGDRARGVHHAWEVVGLPVSALVLTTADGCTAATWLDPAEEERQVAALAGPEFARRAREAQITSGVTR